MNNRHTGSSTTPELSPTLEQILERAEAAASARGSVHARSEQAGRQFEVEDWLRRLAVGEFDRLEERLRVIPEILWPPLSWPILLRIFLAEQDGRELLVSDIVRAFPASQETTARSIAGIIVADLVTRNSRAADGASTLEMTDNGRRVLRDALIADL